jgi:hypothetical protein
MGDRRNWVIALLAVGVVGLAVALVLERYPDLLTGPVPEVELEQVRVIDVSLDRESLNHVDVFFDHPLGARREGESFAEPPASLEPPAAGVWRWQGANILRFEASDRLRPATRYTLDLRPERLVGPEQLLVGETRLEVVTDLFQVERVVVQEEPLPEAHGHVRLRGTVHFNYPVVPRELAPRIELFDPETPEQPVPVLLETDYRTQGIAWHSEPVQKRRAERTLELRIEAELGPAYGNVTLGDDFVHEIPLGSSERLELRKLSAEPGEQESTLRLAFSSPVDPGAARGAIVVEPAVEFSISRERNELRLRGPFRPGASYALRLEAGLRAMDDSRLQESATRRVSLPDLPASVDFESTGMFLSASGARSLRVRSVNVAKIEVTVERVYRNNVLYLLENESWAVWRESGSHNLRRLYGDTIAERTLEPGGERNRSVETRLDLDDWVDDSQPGLYRVLVGPAGETYRRHQRWVLVTDLGLVAKLGREDALVWVSSFANLEARAGVHLRLLSEQNQVLAEGRSDARGLVHWRGLAEKLEGTRPALITAEHGSDWSFLPLDQTRIDVSRFDVGGATAAQQGYDAYLATCTGRERHCVVSPWCGTADSRCRPRCRCCYAIAIRSASSAPSSASTSRRAWPSSRTRSPTSSAPDATASSCARARRRSEPTPTRSRSSSRTASRWRSRPRPRHRCRARRCATASTPPTCSGRRRPGSRSKRACGSSRPRSALRASRASSSRTRAASSRRASSTGSGRR